ncbi:MAG: DinB family protein [Anaerolineae bacterium]|jgi:hypothetical protein|nr:DinB family protein [Anaerolineae bacterium]
MTTFPFDPIARLWVNARAKRRSYASLITALEKGMKLAKSKSDKPASMQHHALWTHIIGIEIWSQKKLAGFFGEPIGEADYDPYRPPKDTPWDELYPMLQKVRQDTIALAKRLENAKISDEAVVFHKGWGNLTAKGWLLYIITHADVEFKKIVL